MKKVILILSLTVCSLTSFAQQTGTFTDPRDNKVYKTVKICKQTWLAENFAYKPSSGNYWAFDNDQSNVAKYGYLYDWETAKSICPSGWHLPNYAEFRTLEDTLGGIFSAGRELKVGGSCGFNALLGGFRNLSGQFQLLNTFGNFWSSTLDDDNSLVKLIVVFGFKDEVSSIHYDRQFGASVRYVKN